ncbi:hypothetical protein Tco_0852811 [Tanacetum coccineum]
MDELIAHVFEKTYAYGAIRAENQNLLATIFELKARMKNGENGTDKAKITRKRLKPGKNKHGNGRARKKPGASYQSQKVKHQSTLGQHGQH